MNSQQLKMIALFPMLNPSVLELFPPKKINQLLASTLSLESLVAMLNRKLTVTIKLDYSQDDLERDGEPKIISMDASVNFQLKSGAAPPSAQYLDCTTDFLLMQPCDFEWLKLPFGEGEHYLAIASSDQHELFVTFVPWAGTVDRLADSKAYQLYDRITQS